MNFKYSSKQNFRKYKTDKEPYIFQKIQRKEDQSLIEKIKQALGIETANTNYSKIETQEANYIKIPSKIDEIPSIVFDTENELKAIDAKELYEKYSKLYSLSNNLSSNHDFYNEKRLKTKEVILSKRKIEEEHKKKAKEEFLNKMDKYSQMKPLDLKNYEYQEKPKNYKRGHLKPR